MIDAHYQAIAKHTRDGTLSLNDNGLSACFAATIINNYRYNVDARCWMLYNGRKWVPDVGNVAISEEAKRFSEQLYRFANCDESLNEGTRALYLKAAAKYGALKPRQTLIADTQTVYPISNQDLDADANLFNCRNATLDLTSFRVRDQKADDVLSKTANVDFDPDAKSELWEQFVLQIMDGDTDKVKYLQRVCGYCLTADTSLECLWLLYGPTTRNGKSTFVETLATMMGDYSLNTSPDILAQRKRQAGAASGDIARLAGCRLLTASEPPKGMLLDVGLIKTLTGRDTITARNLYEREFSFTPTFKLMINTNCLPVVSDDTLFSSGRVRVIEFPHHFTHEEQDQTLKQKLTEPHSLSGILNWCLFGLGEYIRIGECAPHAVESATAKYKTDSDKISCFFGDMMQPAPGENTQAAVVYQTFSDWCADMGYETERKSQFFDLLRDRNLLASTGTICGKTIRNVVPGYIIAPIYG